MARTVACMECLAQVAPEDADAHHGWHEALVEVMVRTARQAAAGHLTAGPLTPDCCAREARCGTDR